MTTNTLGKLYEHLSPWERLPAMWAAKRRGDQRDYDRLLRLAPRMKFSAADILPLHRALQAVAIVVRAELLMFAGMVWMAHSCWVWELMEGVDNKRFIDLEGVDSDKPMAALRNSARMAAFSFCRALDSWRLLCADLQVDSMEIIDVYPGAGFIDATEPILRHWAFTHDEAVAYRAACGKSGEQVTSAEEAKQLRKFLEEETRRWM